MKRPIIILTAAAGGLAAGFSFRCIQSAPAGGNNSSRTPLGDALARPLAKGAGAPGSKALTPLAAQLEQQLAVSTGVSRWLEWMVVIGQAGTNDFPDLARLAAPDPVALRMVSARWMELDRDHVYRTLVAESKLAMAAGGKSGLPLAELSRLLFEEWATSSPADAVAALSTAGLPPHFRDQRHQVLSTIMEKNAELALKAISDWHMENHTPDMAGVSRWAAADPRHAAEFALSHPAGYATQAAMEVIGKVWAKLDPAAALEFAAGRRDRFGTALASGVMLAWAAADTAKAASWLEGVDPAVRNRLSGFMLEVWAKTDSGSAMGWIQQHLTGSAKDDALSSVLKGVAENSVSGAAGLIAGMEPSAGRARAAASVARKWWPEYDSGKPPPAEALTWLKSLDPASIKAVVEQVQWQWCGGDRRSFSDFLATPAGAHAPEYAFTFAARDLARQDPRAALEWASGLSAERRDPAGLAVFMAWQSSQAPEAVKWLRQLPPNDARRESWSLAIVEQFVSDRDAAVDLARNIATGKDAAALKAVQALSLPDEIKARLQTHLQIR